LTVVLDRSFLFDVRRGDQGAHRLLERHDSKRRWRKVYPITVKVGP